MAFTSIHFWAAFTLFLTLFALLRKTPQGLRMLYVIAVSLAFFYLSNGMLMVLLPATALAAWLLTRRMSASTGGKRQCFLWLTLLMELLPLAFFKCAQPLSDIVQQMLGSNFSLASIALPIGISFYSFQMASYTIDTYRRDFRPDVSFIEFLFYVSFFPLLLAGPITRAGTFFPQIRRKDVASERLLYFGLWLITTGIAKKAIVADYIAQYNDWIFSAPDAYSGYECMMGVIGFTMQIYMDFSGYSDISIGIAALMGVRLNENFAFPYRSRNVTEFWRCWHISLSTWFRDYLYIPLGGNRHGKLRTCFNLLFTMLVAGLWHGCTPMFLIWGGIHGVALTLHKMCKPILRDIRDNAFTMSIARCMTFCFVAFSWVFFRSADLQTACRLLEAIFMRMDLAYAVPFFQARTTWCLLLLASILACFVGRKCYRRAETTFIQWPWLMKLFVFYLVVQVAIELHGSDIRPFLYFRF